MLKLLRKRAEYLVGVKIIAAYRDVRRE